MISTKSLQDTTLAISQRVCALLDSRKSMSLIRSALHQKGKKYSDLMIQALNYMLNGWDDLQTYRKDGRYTIDNLPAERAIRPFTVSRKNSLHYSSEEGVEMAMTYLTIIETAKMWGLQVKEYLAYVWREVMSGNTDYELMTPEVVILCKQSE